MTRLIVCLEGKRIQSILTDKILSFFFAYNRQSGISDNASGSYGEAEFAYLVTSLWRKKIGLRCFLTDFCIIRAAVCV